MAELALEDGRAHSMNLKEKANMRRLILILVILICRGVGHQARGHPPSLRAGLLHRVGRGHRGGAQEG